MFDSLRTDIKSQLTSQLSASESSANKSVKTFIGEVRKLALAASDSSRNLSEMQEKLTAVATSVQDQLDHLPKEEADSRESLKSTHRVLTSLLSKLESSKGVEQRIDSISPLVGKPDLSLGQPVQQASRPASGFEHSLRELHDKLSEFQNLAVDFLDPTYDLLDTEGMERLTRLANEIATKQVKLHADYPMFYSKSDLETMNETVKAISAHIIDLARSVNRDIHAGVDVAANRQRNSNLIKAHGSMAGVITKLASVISPENPAKALASRSELSAGTVLYSAGGLAKTVGIIQNGIDMARVTGNAGNWAGGGELGGGIYCSTEGPVYAGEGMEYVLKFEVIEPFTGAEIPQQGDLKSERYQLPDGTRLSSPQAQEAYKALASSEDNGFLRGSAYGKDTELVLYRPEGKVRLIGVQQAVGEDRSGRPIFRDFSVQEFLTSQREQPTVAAQWTADSADKSVRELREKISQFETLASSFLEPTFDAADVAAMHRLTGLASEITNKQLALHASSPDRFPKADLGPMHETAKAISAHIIDLARSVNRDIHAGVDVAANRQRNSNLIEAHGSMAGVITKLASVISPENPAKALASRSELSAGTVLYSAGGLAKTVGIIQNGIDMARVTGNAGAWDGGGELGGGVYCSTEGPVYAGAGMEYVLKFEVIEPFTGAEIPQQGDLKSERYQLPDGTRLSSAQAQEAYKALASSEDNGFLRGSAYGQDTELVLYRPEGKVRLIGVQQAVGIDDDTGRTIFRDFSVQEFLTSQGKQPTVAAQWTAERIARTEVARPATVEQTQLAVLNDKGYLLLRDSRYDHELFFKPLRVDQRPVVIEAEIGASKVAHHILPDLVPSAERYKFGGTDGIAMKQLDFRSLPGAGEFEDKSFDVSALDSKQVEQLFAHYLVDWVISNGDPHVNNYGIDPEGNLVGFDKGQAYKYFKGDTVASRAASSGAGPEAHLTNADPAFYRALQSPIFSVHATLLEAIVKGEVNLDLDSPIIRGAIERIQSLSEQDIKTMLGKYAQESFKEKSEDFIKDVTSRCHDMQRQFSNFKAIVERIGQQRLAAPAAIEALSLEECVESSRRELALRPRAVAVEA